MPGTARCTRCHSCWNDFWKPQNAEWGSACAALPMISAPATQLRILSSIHRSLSSSLPMQPPRHLNPVSVSNPSCSMDCFADGTLHPRTTQCDFVGFGKHPWLGPSRHGSRCTSKRHLKFPANTESSACQVCFAWGVSFLSSLTSWRVQTPCMIMLIGSPWAIPRGQESLAPCHRHFAPAGLRSGGSS